jgi:hypothetical protein
MLDFNYRIFTSTFRPSFHSHRFVLVILHHV